MNIIIDIPEVVYKDILKKSTEIQAEGYVLAGAVLNGIPLDNIGKTESKEAINEESIS